MGTATMGRKKKPDGSGPARRPMALAIKGSAEWKAWLERGAKKCRLSVSTLVDLAVAEYLKAHGFDEEPPER